jgi:hypothetical protein
MVKVVVGMSPVHKNPINGRLIATRKGLGRYLFVGSSSVVHPMPDQKVVAHERVGGLLRNSNSQGHSGRGMSPVFTKIRLTGDSSQQGRVLDDTTLAEPLLQYTHCLPRKWLRMKGSVACCRSRTVRVIIVVGMSPFFTKIRRTAHSSQERKGIE